MQNTEAFWNKFAAKYAKSPIADMESYEYTLGRTRSYLSPEDEILEVGCGTGSTALLLAESVKHITASDISRDMLKFGTQKAKDQTVDNIKFVEAELFDTAIDDGPYDGVLALNLLHLLKDTPAAIDRIASLIKPDGVFISKTICQPDSGVSFKIWMIKIVVPVMKLFGRAPYVNIMKISELENIIKSKGFKILETGNYPASPPCRYIVARKL